MYSWGFGARGFGAGVEAFQGEWMLWMLCCFYCRVGDTSSGFPGEFDWFVRIRLGLLLR